MTNKLKHTNNPYLVWIDLETTGLDTETDIILEIAVIITDTNLCEIRRYHTYVNDIPAFGVDPYVLKMHKKSGLAEALSSISSFPSLDSISKDLCSLIPKDYRDNYFFHFGGSSVHFDIKFLQKYFPDFTALASHRIYDVSSLIMAFRMANVFQVTPVPKYLPEHRALSDIETSLAFAKWVNHRIRPTIFRRIFRKG